MESTRSDCQIQLPDGRKLGYCELGKTDGDPLVYCHGWPGSRLEAVLFAETARQQGVRLISIDRPGMGLSDFQSGRRVSDWPSDVECLLQHLGIRELSVIGVSGGAPYAIACAASFPERIKSLGIVAGVGTFDPKLVAKLAWWNRWMISLNSRSRPVAHLVFSLTARIMLCLPSLFLRLGRLALPSPDRAILSDPRVTSLFPMLVREAFRKGVQGPEFDGELYTRPWEVPLTAIQAPVFLWHGDADTITPLAMSREVAQLIPDARLTILPGEGHLSLPLAHFPVLLQTLIQSAV